VEHVVEEEVEKVVEVPKVEYEERIVEVPKIKKVQKFVEVIKIQKVPKYIDIPVEKVFTLWRRHLRFDKFRVSAMGSGLRQLS